MKQKLGELKKYAYSRFEVSNISLKNIPFTAVMRILYESMKVNIENNEWFEAEDLKLNSTVFYWPSHIHAVLDMAEKNLTTKREHVEEAVKQHTKQFEEKLQEILVSVEAFKKKDVTTTDEMKANVEMLTAINERLEAVTTEMEQLNMEQKLLEMEQKQFPLLNEMFKMKEPYTFHLTAKFRNVHIYLYLIFLILGIPLFSSFLRDCMFSSFACSYERLWNTALTFSVKVKFLLPNFFCSVFSNCM